MLSSIAQAVRAFFSSCSSACSSLRIFSAMLASSAAATCGQWFAKYCAANFATFAGLQMKAFDDPGGFVKQVWFWPSGGQETTGNLAKYEAVPESASVPPAQPTKSNGSVDLLYSPSSASRRAGC